MKIPGLSTVKTWAMVGLAAIATIFYGFWKGTAAAKARQEQKAAEKKREVEQLGNEAAYIGLKREQEIRNESVDTDKRDFFS